MLLAHGMPSQTNKCVPVFNSKQKQVSFPTFSCGVVAKQANGMCKFGAACRCWVCHQWLHAKGQQLYVLQAILHADAALRSPVPLAKAHIMQHVHNDGESKKGLHAQQEETGRPLWHQVHRLTC